MAMRRASGTTALDLYRERLREEPTCTKCGYTDEGGTWQTRYRERRLVYRHVCPRCGAIERRTFRFDGAE
ncbi:HVO_0649 family zinc finger protein [Halobaculum lipolyticum]|uniref:HVO_0649 family zinc finger protein n=1 Tax=Halobaculum lipolyticum TaxID=3032001 RepID=A0ABD5WGZ5_9EURY|nr:HVO_0649 family zinc finger protein [Halobaculum sp. DT31]